MIRGNKFGPKQVNIKDSVILLSYLFLSVITFLYSYTQVDLSLTLSRVSVWQSIQKWFQHIGYFQRPLSSALFTGIVLIFFILYGIVLRQILRSKISAAYLWTILIMVSFILWFSYPALSYDLFNHMFTAKTVLLYQKNPYMVTPLQFIGIDPWLSFLHWTHVVSVFSPLWIFVTLPVYLLGFGYFLFQMWSIKLILIGSYLITAWAIGRVLRKEGERISVYGTALFALNPLVIIESLVNAHNDILMMAFGIVSLLYYQTGRKWISWFLLSLSVGTKMITATLIPVFFMGWKRISAFIMMSATLPLFLFITKREIMPWYFLWIIPFIALVPHNQWISALGISMSFGLLLRYAPFLYYGNWNPPVPLIEAWLTWIPIGIMSGILLVRYIYQGRYSR